MDLGKKETQQILALAAGLAGVSTIAYLRQAYHFRNKRLAFVKKQEEFDTKIGFKTAYPYTSEQDYRPPTLDDIPNIVSKLKKSYESDLTKSYEWRIHQLQRLRDMIEENRNEIIRAGQLDLGKKNPQEVISTEILIPLVEIDHTMKHLYDWLRPERAYTNIASLPGSSWIYKDPQGVVLIISPWNYPVNLALVPLIGAIAGGNTVFLKLSRHSYNVGKTLEKLISKYMDPRCIVAESEGGAAMITKLTEQKWDHVFFTGSVSVGRVIYQAVSKNLTPCTLELGGKNPCIVDKDVDIDLAAKRIAWGKFFNAGQTCITADYVLIHKDVEQEFSEKLERYIKMFYGEDPKNSQDFPRIISKQHVKRLEGLFKCGDVVIGGKIDEEDRYVSPTVIRNVQLESELMTDEIFGPVLPLVTVSSVQEAIEFINKRPLPLVCYLFSRNKKHQDEVLLRTRSGACLLNDMLMHFANGSLPFGGVGESGLGQYHGKLTFDAFVHRKAVIKSTTKRWLDLPLRYPPYTPFWGWVVEKILRFGW